MAWAWVVLGLFLTQIASASECRNYFPMKKLGRSYTLFARFYTKEAEHKGHRKQQFLMPEAAEVLENEWGQLRYRLKAKEKKSKNERDLRFNVHFVKDSRKNYETTDKRLGSRANFSDWFADHPDIRVPKRFHRELMHRFLRVKHVGHLAFWGLANIISALITYVGFYDNMGDSLWVKGGEVAIFGTMIGAAFDIGSHILRGDKNMRPIRNSLLSGKPLTAQKLFDLTRKPSRVKDFTEINFVVFVPEKLRDFEIERHFTNFKRSLERELKEGNLEFLSEHIF